MPQLNERALAKLARRRPLALDPRAGRAIKRSVHELEIDTDAARFAAALVAVLRDPDGEFGLIDVKRAPDRAGRDFVAGERFHGCVRLRRMAARPLLAALGRTRLGAWLEDTLLSDYAEIVELDTYRMVYRYLSGSPIAGSSTFLVEPVGPAACRFSVIFEFQEVGGLAITALHRFGIQVHDQVTYVQAHRAAALAGATVTSQTIKT